MKRSMMRKLFMLLCVVALGFTTMVFMVGCDDTTQKNEDVFTANVSDMYIKLGDGLYDFNSNLPEGVTVDCSSVFINTVGEYKIIYTQGKATLEKKAYVFGAPTFKKEANKLEDNYTLAYSKANEIDFSKVDGFGIKAFDSFGLNLEVAVTVEDIYLGKYGDYKIVYSATDRVGNILSRTVTYTISNSDAPIVNDVVCDVADDSVVVNIALDSKILSEIQVYINDTYIEAVDYTATQTNITLKTSVFENYIANGTREFELKISTNNWYALVNVTFEDKKPPMFTAPKYNNYIFTASDSIILEVPQKQKPQSFSFEYELVDNTLCNIAVSKDGKNITLTNESGGNLALGNYTIATKAVKDNAIQRTETAMIKILSEEDFQKIILPNGTNQYGEGLASLFNEGNIAYDDTKQAYKVGTSGVESRHEMTKIVKDSDAGRKLLGGISSDATPKNLYKYLAMDFLFEDSVGVDFLNMIFQINDSASVAPWQERISGTWQDDVFVSNVETNKKELWNKVEPSKWYTVFVNITDKSLSLEHEGGYGLFYKQFADGKVKHSDYFVKNMRFANELPFTEVNKDNIILDTDTNAQASEISPIFPDSTKITYDDTKHAYKIHQLGNGDRGDFVGIGKSTEAGNKLIAGLGKGSSDVRKYNYLAIDFYFENIDFTNIVFQIDNKQSAETNWKNKIYGTWMGVIFNNSDSGELVAWDNKQANTWYTMYIPITDMELSCDLEGLPYGLFYRQFDSAVTTRSDYFIRNIRFENK